MARILLLPLGSHGDIHPLVGLGVALAARGHTVVMIAAEPYRSLAERHGFHFEPNLSAEQFQTVLDHPDLWHPKKSLTVVFEPKILHQ
ncbi:MAG: glycosyltransferase, partial [Gemmataceae bacterium]